MRTLVSGGELTRTGRLVESSIDSGVGKASAVPASYFLENYVRLLLLRINGRKG